MKNSAASLYRYVLTVKLMLYSVDKLLLHLLLLLLLLDFLMYRVLAVCYEHSRGSMIEMTNPGFGAGGGSSRVLFYLLLSAAKQAVL
jgi:hypothetical protein